jgi:hypothetical protein
MFSFASLGHAIASGLENVGKGTKWLITAGTAIESSESKVEDLTAMIAKFVPQASIALGLEKLGYGAIGVLLASLESGDTAVKQNLLNNGADESFLQQLELVRDAFPEIIAAAKAQFQAQAPAVTVAAKQASLLVVQAKVVATQPA